MKLLRGDSISGLNAGASITGGHLVIADGLADGQQIVTITNNALTGITELKQVSAQASSITSIGDYAFPGSIRSNLGSTVFIYLIMFNLK